MSQVSDMEIRSMMKDVAQNAANISTIMNNIADQKEATGKILSYLENDPATGRKGLFTIQQDHEVRIDAIEEARSQDKTKQKIYVGIATFVGGIVMSLGTLLFKLIFGK